MDYFHTDSEQDVHWLAHVFTTAAEQGCKVRISTEGTTLKIKIGEGAWTPPLHGTPDPYRDLRTERPTVLPIDDNAPLKIIK
jgi:hypothetical protein